MSAIFIALQIAIAGADPGTAIAPGGEDYFCTASSGFWTHATERGLETEPVASTDPYSFTIEPSTMRVDFERQGISAAHLDELADFPIYIIESSSNLFRMTAPRDENFVLRRVRRQIGLDRGLRYALSANDPRTGLQLQWYVEDGAFNLFQPSYPIDSAMMSSLSIFGACQLTTAAPE